MSGEQMRPGDGGARGCTEVVREYRDAGGSLTAAELEAPDGARFTVSLPRRRLRRRPAGVGASGSLRPGTVFLPGARAAVMSARTALTMRSGTPGVSARPAERQAGDVAARTVWVSLPYATFGIVTSNGRVTDAAPIARWAVGKDEREVAAYFRRKGAQFRDVPQASPRTRRVRQAEKEAGG
jgi:hypothetical protein